MMISRKEYDDLIHRYDLGEVLSKKQIDSIINFEFKRNIPKIDESPAGNEEKIVN